MAFVHLEVQHCPVEVLDDSTRAKTMCIVIILFYGAGCESQFHLIVEEVILTVHVGNIHQFSMFEVDTSTVCSLIGDPLCRVHVVVVSENIFNVLFVSL
jgi:hypothetical protein